MPQEGAAQQLPAPPVWRAGPVVLALGAAALLLVRFLQLRLPQLSRPFWQDEIRHNVALVPGMEPDAAWHTLVSQAQPILDYLLRAAFWFPWLGHQERALRLPSLVWSLATVVAAGAVGWRAMRSASADRAASAALAVVMSLLVTHNPTDIHYAAEARHYSLVALVSVLWFQHVVRGGSARGGWWLSLLFCSVHFFALPMVLVGGTLLGLERREAGEQGGARGAVVGTVLLLAAVAATELPILSAFFRLSETNGQGPAVNLDLVALGADLQTLWNYLLPGAWLLVVGVLILDRRQAPSRRILLLMAGVVLLVVAIRARSPFPLAARYCTPFLGLGVLAVCRAAVVCHTRLVARFRGAPLWAAWGLAWLGAGGASAVAGLGAAPAALHFPPENFSPYFHIYRELKELSRPLFILDSHCWARTTGDFYVRSIEPAPRAPVFIANSTGCEDRPDLTLMALDRFGAQHPDGVVVLDQKEARCDAPSLSGGWQGRVTRVRTPGVCVWMVEGTRGLADLFAIVREAGFETMAPLLKVPAR